MPQQETNETTTMNLNNDVTINGKRYKAGQGVSVLKVHADDVARMDHEHNTYKDNLHKKQVYETNGGEMAVGGGS